ATGRNCWRRSRKFSRRPSGSRMAGRRRWCAGANCRASPPSHCISLVTRTRGIEMKAFATLLDRLVLTPSRNGKLKLLTDYFRDTPDPDRGYGLAAIAGTLDLKSVKPALLREL